MKKIIPFLFVLMSCSHKITEYELVYINFDRSKSYYENYLPIKISLQRDSVRFNYSGKQYYSLKEVESSFRLDTFRDERKIKYVYSIPKEGSIGGDFILGIDLSRYKVGDTLNSWFNLSTNIEVYPSFVCSIITKKEKINNEEFVTIQERWYDIDYEKRLDHYSQYTYNLKTHFLTEDFSYYEIPYRFSYSKDTSRLVMYRKMGSNKWTQFSNPDSLYLKRFEAEETARDKRNDSLQPFYITLNGNKGGLINYNEISAWDTLDVNLKDTSARGSPAYQIRSYRCIVMDSTKSAKPFGELYGDRISNEIKAKALGSGKGGLIIFFDIRVIDPLGKVGNLKSGPVFRVQ